MSTVFGVLSVASLVALVYLSYLRGGQVPVNYGIAMILALVFAIVGILLGVFAWQEREKFKIFAIIGLVLNGVALAAVSGILYAGSYL